MIVYIHIYTYIYALKLMYLWVRSDTCLINVFRPNHSSYFRPCFMFKQLHLIFSLFNSYFKNVSPWNMRLLLLNFFLENQCKHIWYHLRFILGALLFLIYWLSKTSETRNTYIIPITWMILLIPSKSNYLGYTS